MTNNDDDGEVEGEKKEVELEGRNRRTWRGGVWGGGEGGKGGGGGEEDVEGRGRGRGGVPKQALVFTCLQYKSFENTAGKEEIARNEQFLLFQQCFLPISRTFCHFHQI